MKQKIFMYLFVFSLLLVVFQYANSKRVFEDMNNRLGNYKAQTKKYKDSVRAMEQMVTDASHFSFDNNEDAISYFEAMGHTPAALKLLVSDKLYELNFADAVEHPVIPYASSDGKKMLINTVKLLNHKWLIADFSDGEFWGEVLLRYFVNEDNTVDFEVAESFLYPFD